MVTKIEQNIPPGKRQVGRPKGSLNKTTATAKSIIEETAEALGGAKRMTEWAKEAPENERAFWTTIYPKLLPMQVTGDANNPVAIITREIVAPKS